MTLTRPLRLLYVEWDDASTHAGWLQHRELEDYRHARWLTRQTGYLLEETDRHLMLAGSWCPASAWKDEAFGDITRIPRT